MEYLLEFILVFWLLTTIPSLLIGILRLIYGHESIGKPGIPTWYYFSSVAYTFIVVAVIGWLYRSDYLGESWAIALGSLAFLPEALYLSWVYLQRAPKITRSL